MTEAWIATLDFGTKCSSNVNSPSKFSIPILALPRYTPFESDFKCELACN